MSAPTTQPEDDSQWALVINTVPVNRGEIVSGFLATHGILEDNAFMKSLIEALAPLIPGEWFDHISQALYGGAANHTYMSVHRVREDGNIVNPPEEVLHAMGLEFDENGNATLGSNGMLVPIAVDKTTFQNDPMYDQWSTSTTNSTPILTASRDQVYQAYSSALSTAQSTFSHTVDYSLENRVTCNAFTGETLENLGRLYNVDSSSTNGMAAGLQSDIFNTSVGATNLTGAELDAHIAAQKIAIADIFTHCRENFTPEASATTVPTIQQVPLLGE